MKNLLQILYIAVSITLCSLCALAGQSTEEKIKSAGQCMFTDKLIGSVYSGSCMIPMGPSGKTFKFFNGDYKNMGGSAISDVKVEPFDSLNLFEEIKSKRSLLLFNRTIGRDGNHAVFIVLDILKMPKIRTSERLIWGSCKLNGSYDSEIIAVAKQEDVRELKTISKVWRANRQLGKFEPTSAENVSCEQECVGSECD